MIRQPMPDEPRRVVPVGSGVEEWRAMTPHARETFLVSVLDALSDPRDAMTEGRPHKKAKTRAIDMLGLHFRAKGKVVYLAGEMAVVYPGEVSFSPDVLAVVGVEEPEDDPRLAWILADEGRGLDFVLAVLHRGDRKKDLVDNVVRYARLGIPEYFVFDKARDEVLGYALATPDSVRYTRIVSQRGRHTSRVLGVDLAVEGGRLHFLDGMAELFGTSTLLEPLTDMMTRLERKAEEERTRAEEERTTRGGRADTHGGRADARRAGNCGAPRRHLRRPRGPRHTGHRWRSGAGAGLRRRRHASAVVAVRRRHGNAPGRRLEGRVARRV